MIDNGDFLWIWQGWWPQEDITLEAAAAAATATAGEQSPVTDNRSGEMRWQAERKAAMETAVSYWAAKERGRNNSTSSATTTSSSSSTTPDDENNSTGIDVVDKSVGATIRGSIVWAGLEPLEFKAIFPDWIRRDDVTQINVQVIFFFLFVFYVFLWFFFITGWTK